LSSDSNRQLAASNQASINNIQIVATRDTGIAPFGVHFSVVDHRGRPLPEEVMLHGEFEWDFWHDYEFDALPYFVKTSRDAGTARGQFAAHVYKDPGTYTATVTVITEDGVYGTDDVSIVAEDPNEAFPKELTAVVSQTGDFKGAPPRAERFTDVHQAAAHLDRVGGESQVPTTRLLFNGSETFKLPKKISLSAAYVGSYGNGRALLTIDVPEFIKTTDRSILWFRGTRNKVRGVTVHDLSFDGHYDPFRPEATHLGVRYEATNPRAVDSNSIR
jgi:hypothetical protein